MTDDKAQPDDKHPMSDKDRVQQYRELVLQYEALDEQVDALLARHSGLTDKMSDEDHAQYRELARRRDEVYNQMKEMEQSLLGDENENNP